VSGFTEAEIAEAVDRYLTTQVTVAVTKTGARDVKSARSLVYDLITATLLLRPDSFFYVVWLASNKLQSLLDEQIAALNEINQLGPLLTRPAKSIKSTTELVAAKAAILEVNAGLNARQQGVRGSIGPAVARFRRSINKFVTDELNKNVLVGGVVTETGDELRAKLTTLWSDAVARHAEIAGLAENVAGALSQLNRTALPQSSIQSIVKKIQDRLDIVQQTLEGPNAIQQSREAMLDLLTMKTMLTKASSFRNPQLLLMPLTGDTSQVALLDGTGIEASVESQTSGPYNYGPSTPLALSVNGAPYVFTLPQHSRAEVRSRVLNPWVPNAGGETPAVRYDLGAGIVASPALGVYVGPPAVDGPALAATLAASFAPAVLVTWDSAAGQLVFQSSNPGDESSLQFLVDTPSRLAFVVWAFSGVPYEARGIPQQSSSIASALAAVSPLLDFSTESKTFAVFSGVRTSVPGEEATLWNRVDSGANLVSDNTAVVSSPTKNFQALGIRAGMGLTITAPLASAGDYSIVSVSGSTLTLSSPVPATLVGTYYVGPDYRSVPDGTRVQASSGAQRDNTGFYRVAVGGGQVARIVVDRNVPFADQSISTSVFSQFLKIAARGTTTASGLGALVPSLGSVALGIPVSASETPASLFTIELVGSGDFLLRGVRVGDTVSLTSPSTSYTRSVASLTTSRIVLDVPVPYEPGTWKYSISSYRVAQYNTVAGSAGTFALTEYVTNFDKLDQLVSRLIRGAQYSSQISGALSTYQTDLSALRSAVAAYSVPKERGIDNAVKTMREQGFDRAVDLFLGLEVQTFFSMEADGVSYATWLMNRSALVARNVAPVSKYARSLLVRQEWRLLSFQTHQVDPLSTGDSSR
jgi:hypothetical protein